MKAISLWQPWASLIPLGLKPDETRSWPIPRGLIGERIAIHAAKLRTFNMKLPDAEAALWVAALASIASLDALPYGKVIATARVVGCYQVGNRALVGDHEHFCTYIAGSRPMRFITANPWGDYSPGRWAWRLEDVEAIEPVAAKGQQGLWDWSPP